MEARRAVTRALGGWIPTLGLYARVGTPKFSAFLCCAFSSNIVAYRRRFAANSCRVLDKCSPPAPCASRRQPSKGRRHSRNER